jgi:hypothetical protein
MRLREKLTPDGTIIIRMTAPSENAFPWKRWMEKTRIRMTQGDSRFRTEKEVRGILSASGFHVILAEPSAPGWEETWLIARAGQRDEKKG